MKEKEEKLEVEGEVIEALRSRMFRVRLDNGHEALGYMGGRMKRYRIRVFPGDRVRIELYRDRPREEWPLRADGEIEMFTRPLDVSALLAEAG